jgi:hypothetical protein
MDGNQSAEHDYELHKAFREGRIVLGEILKGHDGKYGPIIASSFSPGANLVDAYLQAKYRVVTKGIGRKDIYPIPREMHGPIEISALGYFCSMFGSGDIRIWLDCLPNDCHLWTIIQSLMANDNAGVAS